MTNSVASSCLISLGFLVISGLNNIVGVLGLVYVTKAIVGVVLLMLTRKVLDIQWRWTHFPKYVDVSTVSKANIIIISCQFIRIRLSRPWFKFSPTFVLWFSWTVEVPSSLALNVWFTCWLGLRKVTLVTVVSLSTAVNIRDSKKT